MNFADRTSAMQVDPRFVSRLTKDTLALIMAGGRGSRLAGLTISHAKPAVPFGGKFRIIDFPLSNCINSGIRRISVLTQYKAHSLLRHLQMGWGFLRGEFGEFVELVPAQQRVDESSWYAGTADAVFQNLDIIRAHAPKYVLILAGDHIYKMDYGRMLAQHVASNAQITVGCIEVPCEEARAFGVMSVDEDLRICSFVEKPDQPESMSGKPGIALASMGIYVFDTLFLLEQLARDAAQKDSAHDFGRNIIPGAIGANRVFAHPFRDATTQQQAYWRDVGTVDAYWQANMELTNVMPALNLYDSDWPIWTYQAQVAPAKFVVDADEQRGMAVDSLVAGGCIVSGASIRNSVLFSSVRVEASSRVEESLLLPSVVVGRRCRIRRAVIVEGCQLPEGTVIGEDLERDRRLYHVTEGGIVLVTPESLGQTSRVG